MKALEELKQKIQEFKRRYYLRQLVIGAILFLLLFSSLFVLINGIESSLWMSSTARTIVFFASIAVLLSSLFYFILLPIGKLFRLRRGLSDEEAAVEISASLEDIDDQLLNTLQLQHLSSDESSLIEAAIERKTEHLRKISFLQAVDFSKGKKYAAVLGVVLVGFALASFIQPGLFEDSTKRIVNYDKDFSPEAPFTLSVADELKVFRGEDFELEVIVDGSAIPAQLRIHTADGQRIRMQNRSSDSYQHIFKKVQKTLRFRLEGEGFYSREYKLEVYTRPDLIAMQISAQSPRYTDVPDRTITNSGDFTIVEGSTLTWNISTVETDSMHFALNESIIPVQRHTASNFLVKKRVFETSNYRIQLFNEHGTSASELNYNINVIKDQKPKISAEYFPDSSFYRFVTVAGNIVDDYGFSSLQLNYRTAGSSFSRIPLELTPGILKQSFYANWNIDTLDLKPGERLEFYVSVSDNDQVNGAKTAKSQTFIMVVPGAEEIEKILDKKSQQVENQLDKSADESKEINERLKEIEERLRTEQKLDWQERKQLSDVLQDREKLEEQIQELQEQHEELQRSTEQFNKRSEQTKQQNEQLQNLLDELLDEKTRELYEKLKELLKDENASSEQVRQEIQNIQRNERNLERELDRAMELFKRLKMESALEQNLQSLDTLSVQQKNLADENTPDSDLEKIEERQKQIEEEFSDFREKMDEVEQLNQELKRPEPLQDFDLEERQISKELREIRDQLEKQIQQQEEQGSNELNEQKQQQDSQDSPSNQQRQQQTQQKQQKASERMKQLSQKLTKMQSGMQMEMMQANLDQLRDILDNLVKLSFNQEDLLTEMRSVNQSDPRFLELSQGQLKLKDDAKVLQDSLLSLAEKVVQISAFITREVGSINENIDEAVDHLKDRNRGRALASQQFAMTSINNLALLLDDTMQQMQMAMSEAMGNPSQGEQQQNGLPDLQQLQQQLGEQINELRESGKTGRELSEELARLAAEQEMIRQRLEMIRQMQQGQPGGSGAGDDLRQAIEQMERNEIDLVNKRLTRQLINRQKAIETRLLEAEKAQREQEMEEEREAESPSSFAREIPPQFEEYLKSKQKEIELLKTIPAELNPFYKKEVNDYFRRISSDPEDDR